jgi:hypothetical protein
MIVADQDSLRERFRRIGGDWLAEKLTPKFAARAGTELVEPEGVNLAVALALHDACEGMPPAAAFALQMQAEDIAAALAA